VRCLCSTGNTSSIGNTCSTGIIHVQQVLYMFNRYYTCSTGIIHAQQVIYHV